MVLSLTAGVFRRNHFKGRSEHLIALQQRSPSHGAHQEHGIKDGRSRNFAVASFVSDSSCLMGEVKFPFAEGLKIG